MIANSKAKLIEAATGKAPTPPTPPIATPKGQALLGTISPQSTYEDFLVGADLVSPVAPTQGLSSKGRYGGFYTAGDLETAITGEAWQRNAAAADWAQSLRDLAMKSTGQLKTVAQQTNPQAALRQRLDLLTTNPASPKAAQLGQQRNMVEPWTEADQEYYDLAGQTYRQKLKAEETAGMVEQTPLSAYARAIATQRYGMNPALAAGTFGTEYDIEAQKALRDEAYYNRGFAGYEDFLKQQELEYKMGERAASEEEDVLDRALATGDVGSVEAAMAEFGLEPAQLPKATRDLYYLGKSSEQLGFSASRLPTETGMTPDEIYATVSDQVLGPQLQLDLDEIQALINEGDDTGAVTYVDTRIRNAETEAIGRILSAYVTRILKAARNPAQSALQLQRSEALIGE